MDDAVQLLSDIGNSGVYGHTNETYLGLLELVAQERVIRRLRPETRVQMFHALAICLTNAADYDKALVWFDRVRRESVKLKDRYWLGQYYVNSGITLNCSGKLAEAARAYERAIRHGEQNDDVVLISRALGNLAQVRVSEGQPEAAIALLDAAFRRNAKEKIAWASRSPTPSWGPSKANAETSTSRSSISRIQKRSSRSSKPSMN